MFPKRKQKDTKREREREFKMPINRLVHLHNDDNYKCLPSPLSTHLTPFTALCDNKRENDLNALAECVFPAEDLQTARRAGTFCLELMASAKRTRFKSPGPVLAGAH